MGWKKWPYWLKGGIIFVFLTLVIYLIFFINHTQTPLFPKLEETSCNIDDDCILSTNHPSYQKGICVNKNWQEEWNKNPKSENYLHDCLAGVVCTGPKFVLTGTRVPKNCECADNSCQASDLKFYPGCQWVNC